VTKLLQECRAEGNIILMIDEVHTLVGAGAVGRGGGGGGGGLDISNMLKPALARGELQCIGATTLDEHRKHIERDAALERRFQPVLVEEPSPEEALAILEGLQERYERHHRVAYSSDALAAAVALSARYIPDRQLPDKAIDLIDEAGSRVRIAAYNARRAGAGRDSAEAAATSYLELEQVVATKGEAVADALFEEAALLRLRELELKARLSGEPEGAPVLPVVEACHVEQVVSAWSGVPVERMSQDDRQRLLTLADVLRARVIGQDDACDATARAIMRASSGLKNPDRPIATLMFSGPTGVGKTELTKRLADHYFGSESSMVRLDMSEYMERHTVSKLIGAPPGYVGYNEGGKLTEAVRRRPFSVVLFDEIEKAHPDVFNVLLQVIEDGRLTDSQGRTVSFKNCLIILTSNVGSSVIAKGGATVGFQLPTQADPEADKYARVRGLVLEELKAYFRPELLNRMDEVVVFRSLGRQQVGGCAGGRFGRSGSALHRPHAFRRLLPPWCHLAWTGGTCAPPCLPRRCAASPTWSWPRLLSACGVWVWWGWRWAPPSWTASWAKGTTRPWGRGSCAAPSPASSTTRCPTRCCAGSYAPVTPPTWTATPRGAPHCWPTAARPTTLSTPRSRIPRWRRDRPTCRRPAHARAASQAGTTVSQGGFTCAATAQLSGRTM
jgi:ATP-dependent Clp protease ATP-binding subunit ClpC